jgi:hypothetical protein
MPKISEFYGIAIYMYYRDHNPPHFHVTGSGCDAVCNIATFAIEGDVSRSIRGKIVKWAAIHQAELLAAWNEARNQRDYGMIEPLE